MVDNSALALRFAEQFERRLQFVAVPPASMSPAPEARVEALAAPPSVPGEAGHGILSQRSRQRSVSEALTAAKDRVALSGTFDPGKIVDGDSGIQATVLNLLVPDCVVNSSGPAVTWFLKREPRQSAITRMRAQGTLASMLRSPLPQMDAFGTWLRIVLTNPQSISLKTLRQDELLAINAVIEALEGIHVAHPDPSEVRRLLGKGRLLSAYDGLLDQPFLGRASELRAILDFVERPPSLDRPHIFELLVLAGMGGSGKSTLLAHALKSLTQSGRATIAALDFDRPGIDAEDTYWLEQEIARQVGRQYPAVEEVLREVRQEIRQEKAGRAINEDSPSLDAVSQDRGLRRIVPAAREALVAHGYGTRPVFLVLDTFEEVANSNLRGKILYWLSEVADSLAPLPLKVVISGRLSTETTAELSAKGGALIELPELDQSTAERLLVAHGVDKSLARRSTRSAVVPRRPLELQLLARVLAGSTITIEELEAEVAKGGPRAKELFTGMIYRRVLLRIRDEKARIIAYPGLVLRYVTPDLVDDVLAPALGIEPMGAAGARQALDALASQEWLAHRDAAGRVWHSKELRRSMLALMISEDIAKATRVHEEAIRYFDRSSSDEDQAEAIYHRLMLLREPQDEVVFDLAQLRKANAFLSKDAVDLPRPAAALLRFAVTGKVQHADVPLLPRSVAEVAYDRTGKALVRGREYGSGLTLLRRMRAAGHGLRRWSRWEADVLFACAEWQDLADGRPNADFRDPPTLPAFADLLFPWMLSMPSLVSMDAIEEHLAAVVDRRDPDLTRGLPASQVNEGLSRLPPALLLFAAERSLSTDTVTHIRHLAERLRHHLPEDGSLAEWRLLFLELAVDTGPKRNRLGVPNLAPSLLRLDKNWAAELEQSTLPLDLRSRGLVSAFNSELRRFDGNKRRTARGLLSAVDRLRVPDEGREERSSGDHPGMAPKTFAKFFRGPDTEYREPIKSALLDAFPRHDDWVELASLFARVIHWSLDDLAPDVFAAAARADPDHGLDPYVELADRCWSLGELLALARQARPDCEKLGQVGDAYRRWSATIERVLWSERQKSTGWPV